MKIQKHTLYISALAIGIFASIWVSATSGKTSNPPTKEKQNKSVDTTFTMVFAGDLMGHQPMISAAWNDSSKQHEYEPWFQFIKPYLNSADYTLANLEVTLAGEPYTGYPQFSSPDNYAKAIKNVGIDFLFTANNHSQDRGKAGIERTIKVLDDLGIPHTGTFIDTNSRKKNYPAFVTIKGCNIALLNYSYGTNGLVVSRPNIVNIIDNHWMEEDIKTAHQKKADAIIPVVHWGLEYMTSENAEQQSIAKSLAEWGSTAIIGMHPHVVQPIKTIKIVRNGSRDSISIPVAYSLGNFISNQRDINRDGGIMVKLFFRKKNGKVLITDVQYLPFWVWRLQGDNKEFGLKRGYYVITQKQLNMLRGDDAQKAAIFFENVRKILSGNKEWIAE